VTVTFAGSPDRAESRLVPEAGYELDTFRVEGLPRRPGLRQLRAAARSATAPFQALRILERRRPDVVLGGGGFVAGPVALAAWLRRIPTALTEADARLGLANRLAAPFAERIFLAYAIPGRNGAKYRVVGRPVPTEHVGASREAGRTRFGLPVDRPVVAVFGALAGARTLNELAVSAWADTGPAVLHVAGERDYEALRSRVSRSDYVLMPRTEHFGDALAAADLAVSRSGGTVWELAAVGLPAVLVPYPHATGDHQTLNAWHFARGGGAVVVADAEAASRVPSLVAELLADQERLERMRQSMLALARPGAADEIAGELIELARR
jgi:UDP-N-acetylglucosamine--N-acetylmuramyl-(pentapeptide) pyrophosphoryl-undecaprenol N-acetylglucosamine transferase